MQKPVFRNIASGAVSLSVYRMFPLFLALALLLAFLAPDARAGALAVKNGRFVDARGGVVVLRGFNLSQYHKRPPFLTNDDPLLFTKLKEAGVNVVRHQFNWEAYETSPGVYDERYLDHYAEVTNRAAASGIYVLIDIHQDAFSRWSLDGCGEGFPRWAIPPGFRQSTPDNGLKCWGWPIRVMLDRTNMENLFNAFYTPGFAPRERYLALLDKLAQRFAGNPWIVGYDLLNEPQGDAVRLMQLYTDGIAVIRRRDPSAIAFISPEMLTGSGLEDTKLAPPPFGNVAFAPHYYDPTIYGYVWLGTRYEPVAAKNRALAARWGAAVMLSEFGAPPSLSTAPYVQMIYNDLDNFGDSATQWSYTPEWNPLALDGWNGEDLSLVDNNGAWRGNFIVRPFAQRTAGTYGAMKVVLGDLLTPRSATFTWNNGPTRGATEIFLPRNFFGWRQALVYRQGMGLSCSYRNSEQILSCASAFAGTMRVTLF